MNRPTITFNKQTYEKLEERMQKKGIKSLSECVRELVDLALKIEEAASKSTENDNEIDLLSEVLLLKNLVKHSSTWSLEARMLTRFLVEANSTDNHENKIALFEQCKNKAQSHVNELMEKPIN